MTYNLQRYIKQYLEPALRYSLHSFPVTAQDLIRNSAETLSGRINYIELAPFGYNELLLDNVGTPSRPNTECG